jgi:hypothetical protein
LLILNIIFRDLSGAYFQALLPGFSDVKPFARGAGQPALYYTDI